MVQDYIYLLIISNLFFLKSRNLCNKFYQKDSVLDFPNKNNVFLVLLHSKGAMKYKKWKYTQRPELYKKPLYSKLKVLFFFLFLGR